MHIYSDVDTIDKHTRDPTYCATNDVKYCTHSSTTKVQQLLHVQSD